MMDERFFWEQPVCTRCARNLDMFEEFDAALQGRCFDCDQVLYWESKEEEFDFSWQV